MAKGQSSKDYVAAKLREVLKDNYIGEEQKKLYFQFEEDGEPVQICVSMTCPKVMRQVEVSSPITPTSDTTSELPAADKQKVQELLEKLGF